MIDGNPKFCPYCGNKLIEKHHSGRRRPGCPSCGWVFFPDPKVAVAVLVKKCDQVLLVQRRYDPQKGFWSLPSGYVDAGEDPKQTAIRECLEETGLVIKSVRLLDVMFNQEHLNGASILITYEGEIESGQLKAGDDAKNVDFFEAENLPALAFASTKHILTSDQ
jgi:ADP-ribose pyrophosphatase YjhB (NUDIX family)